ncbi:MAG: hypothetical protein JWN04_1070 [Myxococcaceae bacterium]|nr:hypothetical protein [Myxococcaceae bacterium]
MCNTPIDIPMQAPHVMATYAETHVRAEITPNNPKLAFDLMVPRAWVYSREFGPVTQMMFQAQGLGFFAASAERGAPVIAVTMTPCPFEVPLDAWARVSATHEGWTIIAGQWFPGPNGPFFDLTSRRQVDGVEFIRRTSVRADQGKILSVNCMCARDQWDSVKETFWAAHVTFALVEPTGDPSLEHWVQASTHSPNFQTAHPASWSAEPAKSDSDQIAGLHLRLSDTKGQTLLAYIVVRAERASSDGPPVLAKLVARASRMLAKSSITLKSAPKHVPDDQDIRSAAVEGWLGGFTADAHVGTSDVVVRLGFVERSSVIFTLALCSPKLEDDVLVALRAQRAFEIVRSGLRTSAH